MLQENIEPQHIEIDDLLFFDELNAKEKQHIKKHLKECFTCSEKYREFAQIQSALQKMKTLTHIDNKLLTGYVILKSGSPPETFHRQLNKEEIELVEKHLEECPLCQEEFKLLCKEYSELDAYFENISFGEVTSVSKETVFGKLKNQTRAFWLRLFESFDRKYARLKWGIAVIFFLVGLFGIYPLLKSPANKYESLAKIEPAVFVPMTLRDTKSADPAEAEFAKGMAFYQKGQYGEAIKHLKKTIEEKPEHEYARFYLGVCYLLQNEPGTAIQHLEIVAGVENSPLLEKSFWYLGQAYSKIGQSDKALGMFKQVLQLQGAYKIRAEEVIKQVKELH